MKYVNDIEGNFHFKKYIESAGIIETKDDELFSHRIYIRMASGREYIMGEYTSYDEAYGMLEDIVEEIVR